MNEVKYFKDKDFCNYYRFVKDTESADSYTSIHIQISKQNKVKIASEFTTIAEEELNLNRHLIPIEEADFFRFFIKSFVLLSEKMDATCAPVYLSDLVIFRFPQKGLELSAFEKKGKND